MNSLIGTKCKGFKFEDEEIGFSEKMNDYIGKVGEIVAIFDNKVRIEFGNKHWNYPLSEIEDHLISDIPEIGEGVLMEVSNDVNFYDSNEIDVLLKYKGKFISIDEEGLVYSWKYGRPIQQKVTLTHQEIADKFDIDINQLIIEK